MCDAVHPVQNPEPRRLQNKLYINCMGGEKFAVPPDRTPNEADAIAGVENSCQRLTGQITWLGYHSRYVPS